jgi:hypothetical protein
MPLEQLRALVTTQIDFRTDEALASESIPAASFKEAEVLRKAAEHAKTDHHMDIIPPEVLSK